MISSKHIGTVHILILNISTYILININDHSSESIGELNHTYISIMIQNQYAILTIYDPTWHL